MSARRYPWGVWFGQRHTNLTRGVDYQLSQSMMYQTIKNNASQRRLRVRVRDTGDGMTIEVMGRISDGVSHPNKTTIINELADSLAQDGED